MLQKHKTDTHTKQTHTQNRHTRIARPKSATFITLGTHQEHIRNTSGTHALPGEAEIGDFNMLVFARGLVI